MTFSSFDMMMCIFICHNMAHSLCVLKQPWEFRRNGFMNMMNINLLVQMKYHMLSTCVKQNMMQDEIHTYLWSIVWMTSNSVWNRTERESIYDKNEKKRDISSFFEIVFVVEVMRSLINCLASHLVLLHQQKAIKAEVFS
jgi:hypothetical protein